jgi:uncharacterized membrane protein
VAEQRLAAARPPPLLRAAAIGCHLALLVAAGVLAARAVPSSPWREVAAVLAALPLLATLPSLLSARRRAAQWLTLLLVAYAGAAVVEVVANPGALRPASVALLAALAELGLVLAVIRRSRTAASG